MPPGQGTLWKSAPVWEESDSGVPGIVGIGNVAIRLQPINDNQNGCCTGKSILIKVALQ